MRFRSSPIRWTLLISMLMVGAAAVSLLSAPDSKFTERDKVYYADPVLVNFVRPGLMVKIASVEIAQDGTIRARLRLSDPKGLPLDRTGVATPGEISLSLIAAYIPRGQTQYVSYTTRPQTSPITRVTAVQASSDSGGASEAAGEGEYIYTFGTKAPANFDRVATHTIGVWASRDLSEFDLGVDFDDDVYTFVPDGSRVTQVRDVIRTETCNKCHDPLSAHGGARKSVELCVMCHTPQTMDPDTGNTVDMPVMIHKIHRGKDLPSVQAGRRYQFVGFQQSVFDFSGVVFPADVRNCQFCHEPGPAQANNYLKPYRAACGSCHDNVNFATGEHHADLPQVSDNQCSTCHFPQGELEFDVSILGAHTIPRFSRDLPGVVFELLKVDDGVAGKRPTVTFSIRDRSGRPIPPSQMARLALVLAGPTSDYSRYVVEDASKAEGTSDGRYFYTFQTTISAEAKGTFAIGIEGYRNIKLLEGTNQERTVRDAGVNRVTSFSVDSSVMAPRRAVVSQARCNSCHYSLEAHGSNRNQVEFCVLCHNPTETDEARRPASELPAQSVDFRIMVHKIHTGEDLEREYTVYGFGGAETDFTELHYPGDRRNCPACHVNGSEQLPLRENLLPVTDPRGLLNPVGPATTACTSCHTSVAAASHALVNTTRLGESCDVCHASGAQFSINRAHAR